MIFFFFNFKFRVPIYIIKFLFLDKHRVKAMYSWNSKNYRKTILEYFFSFFFFFEVILIRLAGFPRNPKLADIVVEMQIKLYMCLMNWHFMICQTTTQYKMDNKKVAKEIELSFVSRSLQRSQLWKHDYIFIF